MKKKKIIIIVSILILIFGSFIVIKNIEVEKFNKQFLQYIDKPPVELNIEGNINIEGLIDATINNNKENNKKVSLSWGNNKYSTIEELSGLKNFLKKTYGKFTSANIEYDKQKQYIENILLDGNETMSPLFMYTGKEMKPRQIKQILKNFVYRHSNDSINIKLSNTVFELNKDNLDNLENIYNNISKNNYYTINFNYTKEDVVLDINIVK